MGGAEKREVKKINKNHSFNYFLSYVWSIKYFSFSMYIWVILFSLNIIFLTFVLSCTFFFHFNEPRSTEFILELSSLMFTFVLILVLLMPISMFFHSLSLFQGILNSELFLHHCIHCGQLPTIIMLRISSPNQWWWHRAQGQLKRHSFFTPFYGG